MTGEMEAKLEGHTSSVLSVAFSQDGSRVVSGSFDKTVRIWNVMAGEMETKLEGHTQLVRSVAFSQDGSRVVSGSDDETIRIWNVTTGEMETKLEGHTRGIRSVVFSQDGSRVISESFGDTVRIWNATTGDIEAELAGHSVSVLFSLDSSGVVPQLFDEVTICIRNAFTGVLQPPQLLVSKSQDDDWILGTLCDCWIPNHYRSIYPISFSGSKACFGCMHAYGRVIILDTTVVW
jgi:WD40 repeat protein